MKTQWQHTKKIVRFLAVRERAVARFVVAGPPPLARRRRILLRSALLMSLAVILLAPSVAAASGIRARFDLHARRASRSPATASPWPTRPRTRGSGSTCRSPTARRVRRLRGHRRHQHARRLQRAASAVHPLRRADRRDHVSSQTVFLVSLGSTRPGGDPGGKVIGINQLVWDVATTPSTWNPRAAGPAHALRADRHARGTRHAGSDRAPRRPSGDSATT